MRPIVLLLILSASLSLAAQKKKPRGTEIYDQYEREQVAAYRDPVSFTMPDPVLPPPPPRVSAGRPGYVPLSGLFRGGKKVYIASDPRLAVLVNRHIQINARTEKVAGFRVQVYSGNNRQLATEAKQNLLNLFPDYPGYLDFTAPNYTVRLGDFTNKEGATDVMKQVRTQFIGAFVVPDQVYVNRQLPQESQTDPGTGSGNEK